MSSSSGVRANVNVSSLVLFGEMMMCQNASKLKVLRYAEPNIFCKGSSLKSCP